MKWVWPLGLACVLAVGCESDHGNGTGSGRLAGTKWRLVAWSARSQDPARFTITADFDESRISGTSAENLYSGSYTATNDGTFSVGELQSTLMGGSDEAMRAKSLYFELLRRARRYVVSGATPRDQVTFSFAGTVKWQLIESGFFAIDADDGKKYEPINLPPEYRVHGLRVRVTARKRDDMASINMYGTMIEIVSTSRI